MDSQKKTTLREEKKYAQVYGGPFMAAIPLIMMFVGIIIIVLTGFRSTKSYWAAGFFSVLIGFFIYKDKNEFQEAILAGIGNKIYLIIVIAFYFAGVLGKIITKGGLVQGLLWLTSSIDVAPQFLPLLTFLSGVVISTACGTSNGTVVALVPVMLPVGVAMGVNPALMCGAVISGAYFGDNLAPVSDTTIASALTQQTDVGRVVRSRFKYSVAGGIFASIMFVIFGFKLTNPTVADALVADASAAPNLVFLLIPVLVVILMLRGANLVTALIVSDVFGLVLLLAFGKLDWAGIVDANDGLIATGITGMQTAATFAWFIFMTAELAKRAGVIDRVADFMREKAKTARSSEIACGALNFVCSVCLGGTTSVIALCGPVVREIMMPYHIARDRTANMLDGMSCGMGGVLPWGTAVLTCASQAIATGVVGADWSPLDFIPFNFHCMALVVIYWFATFSGWGRTYETDEMLAEDGIYLDPATSIPIPKDGKISKYHSKKSKK